jgi:hypothetical protein
MSYNPNRLQFVHCDTCFENSEKAREYVNGNLITRDRPALYAEPMILKYGDPKNPNILLAIGSVGDGKTSSVENKVFFIDCAQLDIDNNFEFNNSNTIAFKVNTNESGTTVESNVLLQPTKIVDKIEYNNIILNENGGLFTYVNTEVKNDKVVVNVNGNIKSYDLPDPVVMGEYNKETLELTLYTKKAQPIVIDFNDVVYISDNDNNIIKKREDGLYASVEIDYDAATDTLTLDNGVSVKEMNLLSYAQDTINKNVSAELESLHVVPVTSKTVTHTVQKTTSGTTLKSNVNLSIDSTNILQVTDGGVYASVDVTYDSALNKLTLKTSNGSKEIALVNQSFLESISYDSVQKAIVLKVKLSNNEIVTQSINIGELFNPINVENTIDSPIILTKTSNEKTGIETITANLQIAASDKNLIQVKTEGSTANLFASNQADDIKVVWYNVDIEGKITDPQYMNVQEAFIKVTRYFDDNDILNGEIANEIKNAKERITTLENKLAALTDYVNKLTDFGYTDDNEENA